jgi:hypothetical protein
VLKNPLKRAEMTTINAQKMQPLAGKKAFIMLIKALNDADQYGRRHDYIFRHSAGRTESTKEVTEQEAYAIIAELMTAFQIKPDNSDAKRKKLISLARQMRWENNGKADMKRIEKWCVEKGPFKKALNAHTEKELDTLVSVFQKIYRQYMNK